MPSRRAKKQREEELGEVETEITDALRRISIDIAEVYSPPRVAAEAAKRGLTAGESMDLTTGWDFRLQEHRAQARKYVKENEPKLLIGSPMCTMFSTLQNLSEWSEEKQKKWVEARMHIQFVCEPYEERIKGG